MALTVDDLRKKYYEKNGRTSTQTEKKTVDDLREQYYSSKKETEAASAPVTPSVQEPTRTPVTSTAQNSNRRFQTVAERAANKPASSNPRARGNSGNKPQTSGFTGGGREVELNGGYTIDEIRQGLTDSQTSLEDITKQLEASQSALSGSETAVTDYLKKYGANGEDVYAKIAAQYGATMDESGSYLFADEASYNNFQNEIAELEKLYDQYNLNVNQYNALFDQYASGADKYNEWYDLMEGYQPRDATLKDLTWNSLKQGYYNSIYGQESFKEMLGFGNQADAYKELLSGEDYQFEPEGWLETGIAGVSGQLGQRVRQWTDPKTLATATGFAAAAATLGQAGPQIALPEEIFTVPGAFLTGMKVGNAGANLEIEGGLAYQEMKDLGISSNVATAIGLAVGGSNAALEALQADELIKGFKVFSNKQGYESVAELIFAEIKRRFPNVANQVLQEIAQEGVTIAGTQLGSYIDKGEFAYTAPEMLERLGETALSSTLTFGLMDVPGATMNITANKANVNRLGKIGSEYQVATEDVIAEGLAMPKDTVAYKTAAELKAKVDAGQTPTEAEVGRAVVANAQAIQQTPVEATESAEMTPERLARETVAQRANIQQAKRMAGETGSRQTDMPVNVLTDEHPVRQQRIAESRSLEKKLGYGENGMRLFKDIAADGNVNAHELMVRFDEPYQAGLTGKSMATADMDNFQKEVYYAGRMDAIARDAKDAVRKPSTVYSEEESGFDFTNAPSDMTQEQKDFAVFMTKKLGVQGLFNGYDGVKYNANYTKDTGVVAFAQDFGIDPGLMKKLGSMDYQQKVEKLSSTRGKSFVFYVAHEIADHVASDRAPAAMRAFNNAMYNYLQANTSGENLARSKQAFYGDNKVDLTTEGAIEEVVADSILMLYDGDEQKFMDAMKRVLNGEDQQAKEGAKIYKNKLDEIIQKLKAWFRKLTGKENAEARANLKQGITELEQLRDMFESAIAEAAKNVEQVRAEGAKAQATKNATQEGDVKHSVKLGGFADISIDVQAELNFFDIKGLNDYIGVQKTVYNKLQESGFLDPTTKRRIVENADTGIVVEIGRKGIFETFGPDMRYARLPAELKRLKIATIRHLPEIIRYGEVIADGEPNLHNANSTTTYTYIEHPIKIGNETRYVVIDIRRSPEKNRFWVHHIHVETKNGQALAASTDESELALNEDLATGGIILHDKLVVKDAEYISAVNAGDMETAQRMVDEAAKAAGYAEVVYHGTNADFTVFRRGELGIHVGTLEQAIARLKDTKRNESNGSKVMKLYAKLGESFEIYRDYGDWNGKNTAAMLLETEEVEALARYDDSKYEEIENKLSEIARMPDCTYTDTVLREYLQSLGWDSIAYENQFEGTDYDADAEDAELARLSGYGNWSYIVFDPNEVKSADPVTYDDAGNVIPLSKRFDSSNDDIRYSMREQAEALELSDVHTRFSLREKTPPKKTIIAYKAFYAHDGKLYPPMVSNLSDETGKVSNKLKKELSGTLAGQETPVGVWLDADVGGIGVDENGNVVRTNDTKRIRVTNDKGGGTLAFRPGWHLGEWPDAKQFNRGPLEPYTNYKGEQASRRMLMPDGLVFAKCEIAADVDYQLDAMEYGMTEKTDKKGKTTRSYARSQTGLPRVPEDGYYKYRTNVDPTTAPWYITGSMRVVEILDDDDCARICARFGVTPDQRESGKKINLADYGLKRGPVTPTENVERFRKGQRNYENDALLEKALNDPEYADAYRPRKLDFDNPEVRKEFEINSQDADYYRDQYEKRDDIRYSIKETAHAAGLDATRDENGKVVFKMDGEVVTKVTPEHIKKNSGLGGLITVAAAKGNITQAEAEIQYNAMADIMNMIMNTQDPDLVWAWVGSSMFSALKSNADGQYGTTIDFTTVCRKTQDMITAMSRAMMKMKRGLTKDEVTKLQAELIAEGSSVPCPVCYVFSRWAGIGSVLDNMYRWQEKYDGYTNGQLNRRIAELSEKLGKGKTKDLKQMLREQDEEYDSLDWEREKLSLEKRQLNSKRKSAVKNNDAYALQAIVSRQEEIDKRMTQVKKRLEEIKASVAPELAWLLQVRTSPDYAKKGKVKADVLFNLDDAATFAESYPLAWKYRTSRGPSAGKAILPYSDMRLGDMILGVGNTSADGNSLFANVTGEFTDQQMAAVDKAIKRVKAQNLIGGQRFQSTSDFRYDYALDYLMAFFEAQALGSKMQTYTKIIEFADMVAAVRGDVNLSVMPKNKGYITTQDGVNRLSFSSVTGIDFEAAKRANELHDNAQLILVGINDQHILAALEDSEETLGKHIGFVIPYHASGASINEFIRVLVSNLGESFTLKYYQDYSDVQSDKERNNATADQKRRNDLRSKLLKGKDGGKNWEPSADDLAFIRGKSVDISGRSFADLRSVELRALRGDKAAIAEYQSWTAGALWDLYNKMWVEGGAEYGVRLNTSQAKAVMPHEYWNKTVNRDKAYINGFLFRSYCYNLGLTPRFSGATVKGEKHGDFTGSKGYWKTLIDRPMYNNDGTYRDQQTVNVSNFQKEMLTADYAKKNWAGYAVQEPDVVRAGRAADRFIDKAQNAQHSLKGEQEMRREIDRIRSEGQKTGKSQKEIESEIMGVVGPEYGKLLKTYGEIERGEKPYREIKVPKKSESKRKVSQTVRTILEAQVTPDAAIPRIQQLVTSGTFSYDVYTDKEAIENAEATIKSKSYGAALAEWISDVEAGKVSKTNTALGWALYNAAATKGDLETAMTVLNHMVGHQRNAAQALQATRILKKLSPDAQLYGVVKSVQKMEEDLNRGKNTNEEGAARAAGAVRKAKEDAASDVGKAYAGAKVKRKGNRVVIEGNQAGEPFVFEYAQKVGEALAKNLENRRNSKPKEKTFLQHIVTELNRFASEKLPKEKKGKALTATDLLRDYIQNQSFYAEAWQAAQMELRDKYADDPILGEFINSGIGVDANTNPQNAIFMRALVKAAADSGEGKAILRKQEELGFTGMADTIADKLIQQTGATDEMADTIRDAAHAYVYDAVLDSKADGTKIVDSAIKSAMSDIGLKLSEVVLSGTGKSAQQAIVDKLVSKYGFGRAEATRTADIVAEHFEQMSRKFSEDRLKSMFKEHKKGQKTLQERFEMLARLGAFDADSVYNQKAAERIFKEGVTLTIDEELARKFLLAANQEERDTIMADIYRDIGRQIPATFVDKWNAWRYLAMLGNPRTHVRNVVGNLGFAPVVAVKDLTATAIESAVSFVSRGKLDRSKAMPGRKLLQAAWEDYANVADEISAGGKYNDNYVKNQHIEEGRRIFKLKPLEAARKGNSAAMEKEDMWFARPHYAFALAQYCKAHGVTVDQLRRGKALGNGRAYAIKEAQKATYRDTNAFSQMISEMGRYSGDNKAKKAASMVMEGVLPFRKTPANILVRGVEYSPIGLLNGIKQALVDVRKGTKTGAEAIDSIAAGLTGTMLLSLGIYLAAEGLIRGAGGDDEEEKKYEELQGHQAYALELPNGTSVTLDWLAPEVLPLFIGVNLYETASKNKGVTNLSDILSAVTNVTEPMLEMSCLQSLNDIFDSVGYASSNDLPALTAALASAATSYITQAFPTVLGQAERSAQGERMTSYTEKNKFLTSDMQYTLGKISAKTPGWDFQQIPYVDAWGRTESTGSRLGNMVNNFLNPAYVSQIETSDMEEELQRLHEVKGDDYSVLPSRPKKYFSVDGETKHLTAEEYVEYATERGQTAYDLLTDLTSHREYDKLSDAERAQVVELAFEYANAVAKTKVSDYEPDGWVAKAVEGEKYGLDDLDYILYKMALNSVDEPTANGKLGTFTQDEAAAAIAAMPGLTDEQRAYLWQSTNKGWDEKKNPWK